MSCDFTPISLDRKDEYYSIWQATPRHSLDYTLANLWGWQEYYGLEWDFADGLCWIRQTRPQPLDWAPIGDWNAVNWAEALPARYQGEKKPFTRVPEELANLWRQALPDAISIEEDRGQWEYLYSRDELANLPGNRFHKKRNHYNSYVKAYGEPVYKSVDMRMLAEVLAVQDDWCQTHECDDSPSLQAENEAIRRVLGHWERFSGLRGGSLFIDDKMVAFSVGEPLGTETLGVHFEKGLLGYKGIYQAMNLQFARNAGEGFKWINRAQDLDEEGLRQAKLTYLPAGYLKKFRVELNR